MIGIASNGIVNAQGLSANIVRGTQHVHDRHCRRLRGRFQQHGRFTHEGRQRDLNRVNSAFIGNADTFEQMFGTRNNFGVRFTEHMKRHFETFSSAVRCAQRLTLRKAISLLPRYHFP
jgi:hypothetical protein